jgi:cell wall-associated NlpC family hydrolase
MHKRAAALAGAAALALTANAAAQPAAGRAVVQSAVENMYSAPDAERDVVSQATLGQEVQVLELRDGFAHVETPDRYRGWIPASALRSDGAAYAQRGRVAEVVNLVANLYREPSVTSARPRLQAPLATRLELQAGDAAEGWQAVRLPDGDTAFVQVGDVRLLDAEAPRPRADGAALVATARRFLGVPYLWGGMTAWGVDCSGLVSIVYRTGGFDVPRDADLQFDDPNARPVERDELAPGDLVFFGETKVTHVGIYAGEERFVNATTHLSPVVQEGRLDDPHWSSLYRGARRPR